MASIVTAMAIGVTAMAYQSLCKRIQAVHSCKQLCTASVVKEATENARKLQKMSESDRKLQSITESDSQLQKVTENYRKLHKMTESDRKLQKMIWPVWLQICCIQCAILSVVQL